MRGGYRPGAGRPKGSKNKRTIAREAMTQSALEHGLSPLEYLLSVMRDTEQTTAVRLDAAKSAAPYLHAKRMAVLMTETPVRSHEEWLDILGDKDDGDGRAS
jgi:hypothetical protein